MQPIAVIAVVVPIAIFGIALIAYCWKRMGRDVFIAQPYNMLTGKLSKPSRPFRRRQSGRSDDSAPQNSSGVDE